MIRTPNHLLETLHLLGGVAGAAGADAPAVRVKDHSAAVDDVGGRGHWRQQIDAKEKDCRRQEKEVAEKCSAASALCP